MKKLLKTAAAVLGGALLLVGIAAALSHAVYGRSLKASLYELALRRRFATDRTAETEVLRLETLRQTEEPRSAPPTWLESPWSEADREGLTVFTLNGGGAGPLVLFLHGGAYINGFNAHQWSYMDKLVQNTGCEIVAPDYHLAPWADYARAYADLTGLYRDLLAQDPGRRLILMGDSAGGGLALGLAQALAQSGDPLPERLILFSPWVDVSMDNPDIGPLLSVEPMLHFDLVRVHGQFWAGDADPHFRQVSPLFGDMAGLPPVTMFCGTRELLCPDILLARDAMAAAGVDVSLTVGRGLNHDWPLMPIPEADAAFQAVAALVK